jgi:hypothetical protein
MKNRKREICTSGGERYADQHDECAGIHRMPHERIWIVTLNYQRH